MSDETAPASGSATRVTVTVTVLLIMLVAAIAYSHHEYYIAKEVAAQNRSISSTLNATRDQVSALTAKLNAMETRPSPETARTSHASVYRRPLTAASMRHRFVDARWKKIEGQLDEQEKQIESTRQDLASTRTELQGTIAKSHDELVALERKGERNYYEFDLDKNAQFQREGPVSVRLRKANTKHEYADLELLVDDFKLSKKHVNVYEPVVFYPADEKLPVELVINNISPNHIHGYVSAPKYKPGDVEAMTNSGASNETTNASSGQTTSDTKLSPARQRLQLPQK